MIEFSCYDGAEKMMVPNGAILTLNSVRRCEDIDGLWNHLREVRIMPHSMKSMMCATCAAMSNLRELTVFVRDAQDILALLSGFDHVTRTTTCFHRPWS